MRSDAWSAVARDAVRLDRSKLALVPAARCAAGIAVPLVVGELSGHILVGVGAAIGALTAGVASLQGAYRDRVKIMAAAAVAFALSAFVGATASRVVGVDVVVTAIWAFAAGLLVVFGQPATVVGLQAVIGLVIFSQFHFGAWQAASNALWALAGGALQVLLVAVIWPLQKFPVERKATAGAYHLLANYVRGLVDDPGSLLDPKVIDDLRAAVSDTQPLGDPAAAAAFQALAGEADRIRLEAAGIARVRAQLDSGAPSQADAYLSAARRLDAAIVATADALDVAVEAQRSGRRMPDLSGERSEFRTSMDNLRSAVSTAEGQELILLTQALGGLGALAGRLRSVAQLTAVAAGVEPSDSTLPSPGLATQVAPGPPRAESARSHLESVRANLTFRSEAFRHAVRVAGAMAVAVGLSHLFAFGHGYWLPMTVMIVLKPDFASTFTRGLARSTGTVLGAGLATLVLAGLRPPHAVLIVFTVALYAVCVATLLANYAIYSVAIASLVVVLLAFTGAPAASLALDRAFYTVLGAALALAAYTLWPTWERRRVPERLADLVEADGRYGAALLRAWAEPVDADRAALDRLRVAARLARSNAEASVTRWRNEPDGRRTRGRERFDVDTAQEILVAVRRYVWAALALHSQLPEAGPTRPDLRELADQIRATLVAVADSLRSGAPLGAHPPIRATQAALAESLTSYADGSPRTDGVSGLTQLETIVISETDLMVDAVDTLTTLGDAVL